MYNGTKQIFKNYLKCAQKFRIHKKQEYLTFIVWDKFQTVLYIEMNKGVQERFPEGTRSGIRPNCWNDERGTRFNF